MKVINLLGGPGTGKTTTALGLAFQMKKKGLNIMLVQEYAQDLVLDDRHAILEDQIYIMAKQNRRLARLVNKGYDYAIVDSPLPISLLYTKEDYHPSFTGLVMEVFNTYENYNYVLHRNDSFEYNPIGRTQKDVKEATAVDRKLETLLTKLKIPHKSYPASDAAIALILGDHALS